MGRWQYGFSPLDWGMAQQSTFCLCAQGTRPDPQHHSDRGNLAGVSFYFLAHGLMLFTGWGWYWLMSAVHFCDASTLATSFLCALETTAGQRFLFYGTSRSKEHALAAQPPPHLCPQGQHTCNP